MECPYCKKEMQKGFIFNGNHVRWYPEGADTMLMFPEEEGAVRLNATGGSHNRIVSDPSQHQNGSGVANGLTDPAGQVERTVDGALCPLTGEVFIVIDGLANQTPLHIDRDAGECGRKADPDHMHQCRYRKQHVHCKQGNAG